MQFVSGPSDEGDLKQEMQDSVRAQIRAAEEKAQRREARNRMQGEAQKRSLVHQDVVPVILADGTLIRGVVITHPGEKELPPRVVEGVESKTVAGLIVPSLSESEITAILSRTRNSSLISPTP